MNDNEFRKLAAEVQDAARQAVFQAANEMKTEMKRQLKNSFKSRGGRSRGFFQAVSVRPKLNPSQLKSGSPNYDPDLPPIAYVHMGLPFMIAYELGQTITPKDALSLLIRLPQGQKLNLPKVGSKTWKAWFPKNKNKLVFIKANGASYLAWQPSPDREAIPVYMFRKSVKMPKKLTFFDTAERIADGLAVNLARILDDKSN